MSKQKTVLLIILLIIIVGLIVFNVFVFLERKKAIKSPEEIMREEISELAQEMWKNPAEPLQSLPMQENEIPEEAMRLSISADAFVPSVFEVERGQEVVLAVSSQDGKGHILKFSNESLSKVTIGVAPGETRVITFLAPQEPGEYEFFCFLLSHRERGEEGRMIVNPVRDESLNGVK